MKILQGDALTVLKTLDSESINCCVTSPPYWALRDYGTATWEGGDPKCNHKKNPKPLSKRAMAKSTIGAYAGTGHALEGYKEICGKCGAKRVDQQLGLEPTFQEYISKLCDIFDEVKRVLRKDGTIWVNLGDTYSGSGVGQKDTGKAVYNESDFRKRPTKTNLFDKCLIQIPQRFSIEMCNRRGFKIKNGLDRAWLAGIVEGEGCIHIHKREKGRLNASYSPLLSIHNANERMITRVKELVGCGNIQTTHKDRNLKLFRFNSVSDDARMILREVYPHLITKRDQARCALYCPTNGKDADEAWQNIKRMHHLEPATRNYPEPKVGGIDPWILRNTIIWKKPNCMPSSIEDRFTVDFEYVFFFVKSKKYWFETQYEKLQGDPKDKERQRRTGSPNQKYATIHGNKPSSGGVGYSKQGRNKRCVWKITTKPFKQAHFAVFPEELIETPIKAGCPKGGVVLDPFSGSGTTGVVAKKQNKDFIGIELNPEYIKMAEKRIANTMGSLF